MEIRRRPPNPTVRVENLEYAVPHRESQAKNILEEIVWHKDIEIKNFKKIFSLEDLIKKNIIIIILSSITLFLGFLTFLTFIDRSFVDLNEKNLQYLLISNIFLLILLFIFIFVEVKNSIKIDIDKDGLTSNKKYITYFSLFTLIPSILISIFSLFLFSFALEKYFDKKVTTVVNNSYELAKNYVEEVRNKIQSDIILIAFDTNKSANFLNENAKEYLRFLRTQKLIRDVDEIHIIDENKKLYNIN